MTGANYKTVIGLEVHVQLATRTKLFCRCPARFGDEPNTNTCPVCLGLPGALPVMNRHAFELAMQTALALNCEIPQFTKWDRKQYFYPDLPKGYQISQYDLPMSQHGYLEIADPKGAFLPKRVRILRAHLEDDAGKSIHDEQSGKADSRVDLNRTGTPLLEIVSEPDMSSAVEARAFLRELRLLLTYLDVSDCNMQEGSLRVDANVNLHIDTDAKSDFIATPIVEIKNMNSFRAVELALVYEAQRQWNQWQTAGQKAGDVPKQTRGWNDQQGVTVAQRSKEESSDYRYFPDPDLEPVTVTEEQINDAAALLGELPAAIRDRLSSEHGLNAYDAAVLVNHGREVVEYFLAVTNISGSAKQASNWIQRDVMRWLNESGQSIGDYPVSAAALGDLIGRIESGALDSSRARNVLDEMRDKRVRAEEAIRTLGVEPIDAAELESICRELIDANPQIVQDVKSGKEKAVGALIGQSRKRNPNANPNHVRELCLRIIHEM
jgi:aspartyl-tRNA(Asn)/glutamyl-tRNA(Gln) amidotransferase subunit B